MAKLNWETDFEAWMKGVDILLTRKLWGMGVDDIPDQPYYDMWDDGLSPSQGFKMVVNNLIADGDLDMEFI